MQHWNRRIRCVDPLFALDSQHISSEVSVMWISEWAESGCIKTRFYSSWILLSWQQIELLMNVGRASWMPSREGEKHGRAVFLSPWKGSVTGSDPITAVLLQLWETISFFAHHWGVCTSYRPLWSKPDTISSDNHDSERSVFTTRRPSRFLVLMGF